MSLTVEERQQAIIYATNGAMFMYRSSIEFANEVSKCSPSSEGMPDFIKIMIITRQWINLDYKTVIEYCKGTIDSRNRYVFDNGDIKVIPEPIEIS
jgi:hypothetical protein